MALSSNSDEKVCSNKKRRTLFFLWLKYILENLLFLLYPKINLNETNLFFND